MVSASTTSLVLICCAVWSDTVFGRRVAGSRVAALRSSLVLPDREDKADEPWKDGVRLEADPACKWTREPDPEFAQADTTAKDFCEAAVIAGTTIYSLMDAPLAETVISSRLVDDLMPKWTVESDQFDSGGNLNHVSTKFDGKMWWWWPSNLTSETSHDRVLFLHGCHSDCDVHADYYSTMTGRLARHMQMPVLGVNYATEPEHPWPNNVKSVMIAIDYISKNDPFRQSRLTNLYIVGDSEGSLVTMHTMMALLDTSVSGMMGVPAALRPPLLPLAGIVVISPTVNIQCTGESMFMNSWGDKGERMGDISTFSNRSASMSFEDRTNDCRWSYLNYFFGLPAGGNVRSNADAEHAYNSHPVDFWTSPQTNPLFFDYSVPGTPPILVITGAADYFASSGIDLAERVCSSGGHVEHFLAAGMWHDFPEYSEGCGNPDGAKLLAGIEAYKRIGSFAKRHKLAPKIEYSDSLWSKPWRLLFQANGAPAGESSAVYSVVGHIMSFMP